MRVNGQDVVLEKEMTLLEYLEKEGYQMKRIAVEMNGAIVPKAKYNETVLHAEDVLEVVSFVGGG